jgi:hypothetical protein
VFLSGSSEPYGFGGVLTDQQRFYRTFKYKNWLSAMVSSCSNIAHPEDGVAYTEACQELCEA